MLGNQQVILQGAPQLHADRQGHLIENVFLKSHKQPDYSDRGTSLQRVKATQKNRYTVVLWVGGEAAMS